MESNFNIEIEYKDVPRFESGSDESIEYLEEQGYVVIKNALSSSEAAKTLELLWDYLEGLDTGIDRNDVSTWGDERWPTCAHGGIMPSYGIGHSEAQWYLRGIPNVKKAFAKIWNTDELLTSFDGVSLWRPWNINPDWKTESGQSWFHIDQHPISKPGKQCIQGLVNLLPTSKEIGGNVIFLNLIISLKIFRMNTKKDWVDCRSILIILDFLMMILNYPPSQRLCVIWNLEICCCGIQEPFTAAIPAQNYLTRPIT